MFEGLVQSCGFATVLADPQLVVESGLAMVRVDSDSAGRVLEAVAG